MIEAQLREREITLPRPSAPAANYVPYVKVGSLVFISGQLPILNGELKYLGKIGRDLTVENGQQAARLCALNILAQLKQACGGELNRVERCVRLGGFVNSTDDFKDHSLVINGASHLILEVFEDKGHHGRAAIGVNSLPLGVAVEVEAIFEVKEP